MLRTSRNLAQQVKPKPMMIPRWIQLPVNMPGKMEDDGPSAWVPTTGMGESDVPGFRLCRLQPLRAFRE